MMSWRGFVEEDDPLLAVLVEAVDPDPVTWGRDDLLLVLLVLALCLPPVPAKADLVEELRTGQTSL